MKIKYDIYALDLMIREHAVYVFSNTIFGFKVVKTQLFSKISNMITMSHAILKYFVRNYLMTHL